MIFWYLNWKEREKRKKFGFGVFVENCEIEKIEEKS